MRRKNLDLLFVLGIAMVNVIWALLSQLFDFTALSFVNIILALPQVFILPGYVLTETLFPRRALETVQRLVFALALSLAITIVSGFLLNLLPQGLSVLPWAIWLGLFSMLFALVAFLRRHERVVGPDQTILQPAVHIGQVQRPRFSFSATLLFGMAALVIVLSMLYSVIGASQQSHPGFTNVWLLPAQTGNGCTVDIGVRSFEAGPLNYRVVMTTNKARTASWDSITLSTNEQWLQRVSVPVGTNTSLVVLVQVYRLDQPEKVYRHVDLTLHVVTRGTTKECTTTA